MPDYKKFENLSKQECAELAAKLFTEINDADQIEETLLYLSLFTNGESLKKLYPVLIKRKIFYYPEIYRHADESIADKLIQLIEDKDVNINHILICLAWIGTQNVIDFFVDSSRNRPKWTKNLYVSPKEYADQSGWIIEPNGTRRELIAKEVKVLKNKDEADFVRTDFQTFVKHSVNCPFCKNKLTIVFSTQINKLMTEFTTCLLCGCYEPIFMRINKNGQSTWHEKNKKWEHFDESMEMDPIAPNTLVLTDEIRKPEYSINQFVAISKSQIGGYPTWIHDAEYLKCHDCGETMDFIGQIDFEDVKEYGEGIYYFQHCKKCNITGTNYQQT
jgi:hypothetical protein